MEKPLVAAAAIRNIKPESSSEEKKLLIDALIHLMKKLNH
ncbi:MAG: hypothetical protein CM1200mP10_02700 [Candidatus Neomarinimicrobiota bacterium]|nr:MAG: hypothetical protein CM1200mP10_02700 [Candidatus Neomarinimicrobiota bacterium]